MRVLYATDQAACHAYGGAEIQLLKTREYINRLDCDVHVTLFDMWRHTIDEYDIIHFFKPKTFPTECAALLQLAKQKNVKTAISPIHFVSSQSIKGLSPTFSHAALARTFFELRKLIFRRGYLKKLNPELTYESILRLSDIILPNTRDSLDYLLSSYPNIAKDRCTVIPNGVDAFFKDGDPRLFEERFGFRDFVLFVGRIEPVKNLLRFLQAFAMSELDTELVIIGSCDDRTYYDRCKEAAPSRAVFLPPLAHDSPLFASAYKAAHSVVLPSIMEIPGLVALEGGLAGANVAITEVGGTKEYFADYAWYIDPMSVKSIQEALIASYNAPKNSRLSQHIERNFTWPEIAKKTVRAYESLYY
jgi:glycosyltransferase involved in cell wall biosynthesis